jgi:hypothetical protein
MRGRRGQLLDVVRDGERRELRPRCHGPAKAPRSSSVRRDRGRRRARRARAAGAGDQRPREQDAGPLPSEQLVNVRSASGSAPTSSSRARAAATSPADSASGSRIEPEIPEARRRAPAARDRSGGRRRARRGRSGAAAPGMLVRPSCSPSTVTVPELGRSWAEASRNRRRLAGPFGPTMPQCSPVSAVQSTVSRIRLGAPCAVLRRVAARKLTAAVRSHDRRSGIAVAGAECGEGPEGAHGHEAEPAVARQREGEADERCRHEDRQGRTQFTSPTAAAGASGRTALRR